MSEAIEGNQVGPTFAPLIQRRRRDLGMDQAELSRLVGVSQQTVSRWEAGTNIPAQKFLPVLAEHLRLSEIDLLAGIGLSVVPRRGSLQLAEVLTSLPAIDDQALLGLLDAVWAEFRSRQASADG